MLHLLPLQDSAIPALKNELVIERGASLQLKPSLDALNREAQDLDAQIRQLQVSNFTRNFNFIESLKFILLE